MKRSDWNTYRRLGALVRPYRGRLALVLAASAAGPVLIATRIWLLKVLIDTVLAGHHPQLLPAVAIAGDHDGGHPGSAQRGGGGGGHSFGSGSVNVANPTYSRSCSAASRSAGI